MEEVKQPGSEKRRHERGELTPWEGGEPWRLYERWWWEEDEDKDRDERLDREGPFLSGEPLVRHQGCRARLTLTVAARMQGPRALEVDKEQPPLPSCPRRRRPLKKTSTRGTTPMPTGS